MNLARASRQNQYHRRIHALPASYAEDRAQYAPLMEAEARSSSAVLGVLGLIDLLIGLIESLLLIELTAGSLLLIGLIDTAVIHVIVIMTDETSQLRKFQAAQRSQQQQDLVNR